MILSVIILSIPVVVSILAIVWAHRSRKKFPEYPKISTINPEDAILKEDFKVQENGSIIVISKQYKENNTTKFLNKLEKEMWNDD